MLSRLDFVEWPSGMSVPFADIDITDKELFDRTGLQMLPVEDSLGPAVAAGTHIEGFGLILMLRYLESPNKNIGIFVDRFADTSSAWKFLKPALHLSDTDIVWEANAGE